MSSDNHGTNITISEGGVAYGSRCRNNYFFWSTRVNETINQSFLVLLAHAPKKMSRYIRGFFISPAVTTLGMNPRMAALAKCNEVAPVMGSTL